MNHACVLSLCLSLLFGCGDDDSTDSPDAGTTPDASMGADTGAGAVCIENTDAAFAMSLSMDIVSICPPSFNSCPPGMVCGKPCPAVQGGDCGGIAPEATWRVQGDVYRFDVREGWSIVSQSHGASDPDGGVTDLPENTEVTIEITDEQSRPGSTTFRISGTTVSVVRYDSPGAGE